MLWIISQLQSAIRALHSHDSPKQIALGFVLGSLAGWVPFNLLYYLVIFVGIYSLNVNTGFAFIGFGLTAVFSFLLDPFAHLIGRWLLVDVAILQPIWHMFFNMPIVPFTRFNNTVMLGSIVLALVLAAPLYFLARLGVVRYRLAWKEKLDQWRIVRWIQGSKLVTLWVRLRG